MMKGRRKSKITEIYNIFSACLNDAIWLSWLDQFWFGFFDGMVVFCNMVGLRGGWLVRYSGYFTNVTWLQFKVHWYCNELHACIKIVQEIFLFLIICPFKSESRTDKLWKKKIVSIKYCFCVLLLCKNYHKNVYFIDKKTMFSN